MISQNSSIESSIDSTVDSIENKFRAHVFAMRIRMIDLFADFDKLRSGFITASQFRRCIGAAYDKGVVNPLTEDECNALIRHYDIKKNGMIKWRSFVDSIDKVFGAKKLEQTPTKYIPAPHEVVHPVGPVLSPRSESILTEVIEHLRSYVKHHGSDVKSWFKDFDKYNNGYVTYNQFRRGIPQNLLSMEEEDILLSRYGETVTGTVNYFKMNTDVNRKAPRPKVDAAQLVAKLKLETDYDEHVPVGTEELLHGNLTSYGTGKPNLQFVEDKIKKYVYKNRIRLIEFFKDYDRHHCGFVSQAQFLAGLRLSSLPLEDQEISILLSAYQDKQSRIQYRQFCDSIDTVFTTNHLESNPLAQVKPPSRDWLVQSCNELSSTEETRFHEIVAHFRLLIAERRLLLAPFFKDFDKCLGNLGRVTRSHFSRLLSTMKMDISDDDLHILFKKYEDRGQSKVNYMEFIRTIDPQTYSNYQQSRLSFIEQNPQKSIESMANTSISTLLSTIQTHVGTRRIRVSEVFKDFDRLRSYSIPRQEFVRAVDMLECHLTSQELDALADFYKDKNKVGNCKWKQFEADIENDLINNHLESKPSHVPKLKSLQSSPYTMQNQLSKEEENAWNSIMDNIIEHLRVRQANMKPFCKDFDKVCTGVGHITRSQFRQCLAYINVNLPESEFELLCKKYSKPLDAQSKGGYIKTVGESICYLLFLDELEKRFQSKVELQDALLDNGLPALPPKEKVNGQPTKDLTSEEFNQLMLRIKSKVKTERILIFDFMSDFDHMRHGTITKNEFRRGLKVIFTDLNQAELKALELTFQNASDSRLVNYVAFSDEIESVFTQKGLEKNPTLEIKEFIPSEEDPNLHVLSTNAQILFERIWKRMVEKVRQWRFDPLSYLEDYDFLKEGTITTNQFRSVLSDVGLEVDDDEIAVLSKRFAATKLLDRVNYRSFASALCKSAGI